MIGLSPLSAARPKVFQHQLVRPSAPRYRGFGLATDRSPGFGSAAPDCTRSSHSLSLRLRHGLNLAGARQLAGSLCKRHAVTPNGAPTAWGRMISGSLSLPSRGSFHLSLAVLVRYRSTASIEPWRVGPPDSDGVSRVPPYLGCVPDPGKGLRARGCHPLRRLFPEARAPVSPSKRSPATPADESAGLGSSAFARHYLRNLC